MDGNTADCKTLTRFPFRGKGFSEGPERHAADFQDQVLILVDLTGLLA